VRGSPSVDPAVQLKSEFLFSCENVSSGHLLVEQMPPRLDWLWFCGYALDDVVPDHGVPSKAYRSLAWRGERLWRWWMLQA
jgi:hypothetical protein